MASISVHSKAVVMFLHDSLYIVAPTVFMFLFMFMFSHCFVVKYLKPFLTIQSCRWGRESWLLYFDCLLMSCDC